MKTMLFAALALALSSTAAHAIREGRPGPYPGPAPTMNVCFAEDAFGRVFRSRGFAPRRIVMRGAMENCQLGSFDPYSCRPVDCRW